MRVKVNAYAKLNLTLDVKGAANGYHAIDSVVTTVDVFDTLYISKRKDKLVSVEMHGFDSESIPYEQNNAARAAEAFVREFGTAGVDVVVYKNIPVGAGMGGSSADAAGVLKGMKQLYNVEDFGRVKALADTLGSDTGYLLSGGYARMSGRGEIVKPIESKLKIYFMILLPKGGVSTAACYRLFDELQCGAPFMSDLAEDRLRCGDLGGLCRAMNNMLYEPACRLNPGVRTAFGEAASFSPPGVNMTGSGSAVYAAFENAEFCRWAQSRYRGSADIILAKTQLPK